MTPKSNQTAPLAIVTGASQGIGIAITEELARRGHRLALVARREKPLQEAASRLAAAAPAAHAFTCDVGDSAQVQAVFAQIADWGGLADVLVNNAGVGAFKPIHELTDEDWDATLNTNLRGVFLCSRAVAPQMMERGSGYIINISSLAGKNAFPGGSAYCASKWGLLGMSRCMAEDLRRYNIRVSVISPGTVHTEFSPHTGKDPKKMLQAGDVARVVGWLLEQEPQSFASEVDLRPTLKP
jgi:NAD(P)-dependent dehydrogenase (short-subunit alcohol dehydrogenase family)